MNDALLIKQAISRCKDKPRPHYVSFYDDPSESLHAVFEIYPEQNCVMIWHNDDLEPRLPQRVNINEVNMIFDKRIWSHKWGLRDPAARE